MAKEIALKLKITSQGEEKVISNLNELETELQILQTTLKTLDFGSAAFKEATANIATLRTKIDEIKSIVGIEDETEQVQSTQQNNQQQQNVVINIPEQKPAETKTVVIKETAAAPVEKKAPPKKTETEKRKEEGLDW